MEKFTLYKEEFFAYRQLNDSVKKGYDTIFKKIAPLEEKYGKDLKKFNYPELLEVLGLLKSKSYTSMLTKWSLLKIYLECYANEDVHEITKSDLEKNVQVVENSSRYISREDLYLKLNNLNNVGDKALLLLLFEGIMGTAFKDLTNLKVEQIDTENKKIYLENRTVEIDDFTNDILKETINTDVYYKNVTCCDDMSNDSYLLNSESDYLFKTKPTIKTNNGLKPYQVEGMKSKISKVISGANLEHVTALSLLYSGLIEKIIISEQKRKCEMSLFEILNFVKKLGIQKIQKQSIKEALDLYKRKYNITIN